MTSWRALDNGIISKEYWDRASIKPDSDGTGILESADGGIKLTMINMLRALMKEVGNMQYSQGESTA